VEHFVKKTEAEISDIAAELQQQLHNVQVRQQSHREPAKILYTFEENKL